MPVRITLRNTVDFSPYRELMRRLIECPLGKDLVLCSGYIQTIGKYNILHDGLLESIKKGCTAGKVTTIAGKFEEETQSKTNTTGQENYWLNSYKAFIKVLNREKINVEPYIAPERNWHAKIAIKVFDGCPVAALIGSSNLTRPAYSSNNDKWNFEGDVLIWVNHPDLDTYFRGQFQSKMLYGDIHLILDPDVRQLDEKEQLWNLYNDILNSNLTPFHPK